jgi:hypothetical protein
MRCMTWLYRQLLQAGKYLQRPPSSIITGRGMMMVQRRLSMSEEIIDKDERRMLVSLYNEHCVSGDD